MKTRIALFTMLATIPLLGTSEAKADSWFCETAYIMMTESVEISNWEFGDDSASEWIREIGVGYFRAAGCSL